MSTTLFAGTGFIGRTYTGKQLPMTVEAETEEGIKVKLTNEDRVEDIDWTFFNTKLTDTKVLASIQFTILLTKKGTKPPAEGQA